MAVGTVKKSKSALFLIELIIAIMFFAISSAICVQLFAQAHLISQRSSDITRAVSLAQSVAEELQSGWRSEESYVAVGDATPHDKKSFAYYNADWDAVATLDQAVYELVLAQEEGADGVRRIDITVLRIGQVEPLFTMQTGIFTENGMPAAASE